MDKEYSQAFAEVMEILKNSEKDIINKIPKKFMDFLERNSDKEYRVDIDFSKSNWENDIKKETQAILALIYRDYIVSKEEREKLIVEEKNEQARIEQELREKYNPDNIFKRTETRVDQELENNTQLIEVKDYPWYKKFFNKILKILGLKH